MIVVIPFRETVHIVPHALVLGVKKVRSIEGDKETGLVHKVVAVSAYVVTPVNNYDPLPKVLRNFMGYRSAADAGTHYEINWTLSWTHKLLSFPEWYRKGISLSIARIRKLRDTPEVALVLAGGIYYRNDQAIIIDSNRLIFHQRVVSDPR